MPKKVVFTGKGQVAVHEFDPKPVAAGQVRLTTLKSLISTGTEGICLHRLFEPGSHWDKWVSSYPFSTGYCTVGQITETGEGVDAGLLGKRMVARVCHASESVVDAQQVFPFPDTVAPENASWFALAMIAFMGAKAGDFRLGESILVVGAGPVGQMVVRWARACGAEHVGVLDPVAMRRELAQRGGATVLLDGKAEGAAERVAAAFGGSLPDTVVDTTGHAAVFEQCLNLPRRLGKLVLLGDTGTPSQQRLTLDVVTRGIRILGAHISHEEGQWTERRVLALFFNLLAQGRFNVDGLISHTFSPDDAPAAFALTTERRDETMGVLFDWETA